MAVYPGDRRRKTQIPILPVTGELNFDLPVFVTHNDFTDAHKTLDGPLAMKPGAADVWFSLDSAGTIGLDCQVVRCDLSATPADSRIELVVTVPASHFSTTVTKYIYAWHGSETETQPAVDALYGRNRVWNGPAREGFTPLTTWGVWHYGEDPASPSPQFKDSSGNNRHATFSGLTASVGSMAPGQSLHTVSGSLAAVVDAAYTDSPGTSDWCLVCVGGMSGTINGFRFCSALETNRTFSFYTGEWAYIFGGIEQDLYETISTTGPNFMAMSRDGDVLTYMSNSLNGSATGYAAANQTSSTFYHLWENNKSGRTRDFSFTANLRCAPNVHWLAALRSNVLSGTLLGTPQDSQPAAITAYLTISPLAIGTEVCVYEQPHGQEWSVDFDGVTVSALNNKVVQCQVMGESAPAEHYFWVNYNGTGTDPAPGGTGHEVAAAVGDTTADVAETFQSVAAGVTGLTALLDGTMVTVANAIPGELAEPATDSASALELYAIGGTSRALIDGVEDGTSRTWIAEYTILRPRLARIVIHLPGQVPVEMRDYRLTTSSAYVPSGQQSDPNYKNPN